MVSYLKGIEQLSDFWSDFRGDQTLQNAIRIFAQNPDHTKSAQMNDFVINIMQKIIGKEFEKRRLLDLLESELKDVDLSDIQVQAVTTQSNIPVKAVTTQSELTESISIFDADKLDGFEFETFIAKILESNEFTDISVTRGSGDQGGDVLAKRGEEKLIIQAKRFSIDNKVTNSAVQEALGAIAWYNVNKGVVVTNSIFTKSAKELAKRNNIELWDRKKVSEFIEIHNMGQNSKNKTNSGSKKEDNLCPYCITKNPQGSVACSACGNRL